MIDIHKCILTKSQINDAKKFGAKIELEHTINKKRALKIALQHECEFKNGALYYSQGLIPMERRLSKLNKR